MSSSKRLTSSSSSSASTAVQLVEGTLYYLLSTPPSPEDADVDLPSDSDTTCYISVSSFANSYAPFHRDFGPVNAAVTVECCRYLDRVLDASAHANKKVVVCLADSCEALVTNSVTLIAIYLVARYGCEASVAVSYFSEPLRHLMKPFHDASVYDDTFCLGFGDVVRGWAAAAARRWIDVDTFDTAEYEQSEKLESGDITWLIPGVLLALSSPGNLHSRITVSEVARKLADRGVTHIIQLNDDSRYDIVPFRRLGMEHVSLEYPDGDTPPLSVIDSFLNLMSRDGMVAAIHCKAGLGRTGTLACMWMIAEYGLQCREAIGWARLCRPGSVIGPQQQFLHDFEFTIRESQTREGSQHHRRAGSSAPRPLEEFVPAISSVREARHAEPLIAEPTAPELRPAVERPVELRAVEVDRDRVNLRDVAACRPAAALPEQPRREVVEFTTHDSLTSRRPLPRVETVRRHDAAAIAVGDVVPFITMQSGSLTPVTTAAVGATTTGAVVRATTPIRLISRYAPAANSGSAVVHMRHVAEQGARSRSPRGRREQNPVSRLLDVGSSSALAASPLLRDNAKVILEAPTLRTLAAMSSLAERGASSTWNSFPTVAATDEYIDVDSPGPAGVSGGVSPLYYAAPIAVPSRIQLLRSGGGGGYFTPATRLH